jgi:hypothetical protein
VLEHRRRRALGRPRKDGDQEHLTHRSPRARRQELAAATAIGQGGTAWAVPAVPLCEPAHWGCVGLARSWRAGPASSWAARDRTRTDDAARRVPALPMHGVRRGGHGGAAWDRAQAPLRTGGDLSGAGAVGARRATDDGGPDPGVRAAGPRDDELAHAEAMGSDGRGGCMAVVPDRGGAHRAGRGGPRGADCRGFGTGHDAGADLGAGLRRRSRADLNDGHQAPPRRRIRPTQLGSVRVSDDMP